MKPLKDVLSPIDFMGLKFQVVPVDEMPDGVLMVMEGKPFQNPDGTINKNIVYLRGEKNFANKTPKPF